MFHMLSKLPGGLFGERSGGGRWFDTYYTLSNDTCNGFSQEAMHPSVLYLGSYAIKGVIIKPIEERVELKLQHYQHYSSRTVNMDIII